MDVVICLGGAMVDLWGVIGRPHLGPAKSQGHEGQERIVNAETGYGRVGTVGPVKGRGQWYQFHVSCRRQPL